MQPGREINPLVTPDAIRGKWEFESQILELTVKERNPSGLGGSGDYVFKNGPNPHSGTWTLVDWNLELSGMGLMRVIKVEKDFQLIKTQRRGQELRFDENKRL
jgi:hypothetical protein